MRSNASKSPRGTKSPKNEVVDVAQKLEKWEPMSDEKMKAEDSQDPQSMQPT